MTHVKNGSVEIVMAQQNVSFVTLKGTKVKALKRADIGGSSR